ncbi:MAG: hypothetical protein COB41_02475 [Proteobacteria bacterium]|nr:MAG: hypothetical protein COB41_02475 [Pseudomonadota bacterium]
MIQCYAASMAITYTIDLEQHIVFTRVDGVQLRDHQNRLGDDSGFKPNMYELMDCSGVTNVKMKTINKSQLAKSSPWGSDAKRAIIGHLEKPHASQTPPFFVHGKAW